MPDSVMNATAMMPLRIASITDAAQGIRSYELVDPEGAELPPFSPGAHIRVQVPNGDFRKYSLCNSAEERLRYVITVKRDSEGRGGSISLFDEAHVNDTLPTSEPENAFALVERPGSLIFIAGGIGITPFMSMIRTFGELPPAPWKLYYLCRQPEATAFADELTAAEFGQQVKLHHSQGDPARTFDLWSVLEKPDRGHVYCCGPRRLMDDVRDMTGHWSSSRIHFESFLDGGGIKPDDQPFQVKLARSGLHFEIPVGTSILSVLLQAGVHVAHSCESGTCGSCRTRMIEGQADHRDMVLMPDEQDHQIMVCVSRAACNQITLDL